MCTASTSDLARRRTSGARSGRLDPTSLGPRSQRGAVLTSAEVSRRLDQGEVRERLREVAEHAAARRQLLRVEAERAGARAERREAPLGLLGAAGPNERGD